MWKNFDFWKEIIKKAKGIDIGFIVLMFVFSLIAGQMYLIRDETLRMAGLLAMSLISTLAFYIYSKRKKNHSEISSEQRNLKHSQLLKQSFCNWLTYF